jgi:RNA polymerase sigma-70 factor (ECF subfamily)
MRGAVLRLPSRQREVLTLRVDAELPFAEIAAVLDVTENAAKVAFHHATRRLRAEFAGGEEDPS